MLSSFEDEDITIFRTNQQSIAVPVQAKELLRVFLLLNRCLLYFKLTEIMEVMGEGLI